MRIIAGTARGRTLAAPKGMDTRPTLDRVRESLFSILVSRLDGARVLDLFAGSGALGLESLSRGAARAVFVDRARAAQAAVSANIKALGFEECARMLPVEWRQAVKALQTSGDVFDLIFLDPPYAMPDRDKLLPAIAQAEILAPEGRVVFEHGRDWMPAAPGWQATDTRRYGDTEITFFAWGDCHALGTLSGEL